jgi:hypothetical protein
MKEEWKEGAWFSFRVVLNSCPHTEQISTHACVVWLRLRRCEGEVWGSVCPDDDAVAMASAVEVMVDPASGGKQEG